MTIEIKVTVDRKTAYVKQFDAYISETRWHRSYASDSLDDTWMSINDASEEFGNLLSEFIDTGY